MLYQISGKQIDIGAALQMHVKSIVDAIASKYAERPTDGRLYSRAVPMNLSARLVYICRPG